MRKEDLLRMNAVDTAHAIRNMIEENNKKGERPFVPGWEERSSSLVGLEEAIEDLYEHPRKNSELIYFLNELRDSYYLGKEE